MKGKGKGSSAGGKEKDVCPLQFPDLTPIEHEHLCLRYTAVLGRDEADCIGLEEVDSLQTDFETLLASVAKRMRQLETEIQILNNWQEGKIVSKESVTPKDKGKGGGKGSQSDSVKRSGKGEEKPNKKFKESSGKASKASGKGKAQLNKVSEYESVESPTPTASATASKPPADLLKLKVDVPNRFWAMVEPYCADIGNDDLKVLEDLIRGHEDDSEFYKIPALGKHYAEKWAKEDLLEEQHDGAMMSDKRRNSSEISAMLKNDDDSSPFGSLTQRLVQALIEENIMTPPSADDVSAEASEAASISPRSLAKQLNIGSTAALERRIKRELEENGLLDSEEEATPDEGIDDNDEIVVELRKKQQELKALSQHNLISLRRLLKLAKEEMSRQELRHKVNAADNEVMDTYRKIQATRAKKKSPSKKELDSARKALKERESLVKQLEAAIV